MIEMTYEALSNQAFLMAISNIAQQKLPVKGAYQVKKLADAIMAARKEIAKNYMEDIAEKFAKRDEKGEKVLVEGEIDFDAKDPAFLEAQEAFGKRVYKIDRQKLILGLHISDNVELSARELSILDPVLTEVPENVSLFPKMPLPSSGETPPPGA